MTKNKLNTYFYTMTLKQKFQEFKKMLVNFDDEAPVFTEYTLADGTTIITIDSLTEGGNVQIDGNPAPDADYTLSDGTIITVANGVITAVKAPQSADEAQQAINDSQAETNKAVEAEMAKQKAELTKFKSAFESVVNIIEELIKEPTASKIEKPKNNFNAKTVETSTERAVSLGQKLRALKSRN